MLFLAFCASSPLSFISHQPSATVHPATQPSSHHAPFISNLIVRRHCDPSAIVHPHKAPSCICLPSRCSLACSYAYSRFSHLLICFAHALLPFISQNAILCHSYINHATLPVVLPSSRPTALSLLCYIILPLCYALPARPPPSTISHQPSTIHHPPSTIHHPPSAISHQP